MMRYILIQEAVMEVMASHVNERIKDGYVPLGGISVTAVDPAVRGKTVQYTQAMVYNGDKKHDS